MGLRGWSDPSAPGGRAVLRGRGAPGEDAGAGADAVREAEREAVERAGWWCCARCGGRVTPGAAACAREGRHAHTKVNPGGFIFDVRCFDVAPGAMALGLPEGAHTWFAGYAWCFALCRVCSAHLGWSYVPEERGGGEAVAFWGLIAGRLAWVEAPDEGQA